MNSNLELFYLKKQEYKDLRIFLLLRESEIAAGKKGFRYLKNVFVAVFGRKPEYE